MTAERMQKIIYSLQEGAGMTLVRVMVFLVLIAGWFGVYARSQFRGLRTAEAMEYAALGREIARDDAFTTKCLRPSDFAFFRKEDIPFNVHRFPDIHHAPLYPGLLSLGFETVDPTFKVSPRRLFAPEVWVIVPLGILCSLATAMFVFLLGRRLFDPVTGKVAAVIFVVMESQLALSISGTPIVLAALLVTASCYALVAAAQAQSNGAGIAVWLPLTAVGGVLCGLSCLTSYGLAVLLVPFIFFLWIAPQRRAAGHVAVFLVLASAVFVPWIVRNMQVHGTLFGMAPYDVLGNSTLTSEGGFGRALEPALNRVALVQSLRAQLSEGVRRVYEVDLRTLGSGLTICFFLVSLFTRFERDDAEQFKWTVTVGFLLLILLSAVTGGETGSCLQVLLPAAVVCGVGFFFLLLRRTDFMDVRSEIVCTWVLVLLTALPAVLTLLGGPAQRPYPPYYPPYAAYVSNLLEQDEIVCTDIPWATAWYGDRTSLLLPQSLDDLRRLREEYPEVRGLYITRKTGNQSYVDSLLEGRDGSWLPLINRMVPPDFSLREAISLPADSYQQLFLTDRVRWSVSNGVDHVSGTSGQIEAKTSSGSTD